jgi:hypothetical protein
MYINVLSYGVKALSEYCAGKRAYIALTDRMASGCENWKLG